MRFYDRVVAEMRIDPSIKSMFSSSRVISGDNILKYCLGSKKDVVSKDRLQYVPMYPLVMNSFIDISNRELLEMIDTESIGFPNKLKGLGLFSYAYDIENLNDASTCTLINTSYTESVDAVLSMNSRVKRADILYAYVDAMRKYNIKWLVTRFALMELESSGMLLTSFMSTVLTKHGLLPECSVLSQDVLEFAIASLTYNFSLPSVLYAPRGDDIANVYNNISNSSIGDLTHRSRYTCLIEQTPYGRFVELINSIYLLTTGLMNCKNTSILRVLADQIYEGKLRRIYIRHHNHKLTDFDIIQYTNRKSYPSTDIPNGYFRTFTEDVPSISGDTGSYWIAKRSCSI